MIEISPQSTESCLAVQFSGQVTDLQIEAASLGAGS
jgi:hypothetical protein